MTDWYKMLTKSCDINCHCRRFSKPDRKKDRAESRAAKRRARRMQVRYDD